jgi:hypothetical protein
VLSTTWTETFIGTFSRIDCLVCRTKDRECRYHPAIAEPTAAAPERDNETKMASRRLDKAPS